VEPGRAHRRRLVASVGLALGMVVGAVTIPSYGGAAPATREGESKALLKAYDAAAQSRQDEVRAEPDGFHTHDQQTAGGHRHDDPATKNEVSRSEEASTTEDPTTPEEAEESVEAVEAQRAEPDPRLTTMPADPPRPTAPQDRYAMAGGCYALQAPNGLWVDRKPGGYATAAPSLAEAEPFYFKAAALGEYLLLDGRNLFLSARTSLLEPEVTAVSQPREAAVWTVEKPGGFTFAQGTARLQQGRPVGTGLAASQFTLRLTDGCAEFPEIGTGISGRPFAGVSPIQEVRGTVDAHTHQMAFEFLGGAAHCGRPWSPLGVTVALVDCPDHSATGGYGAALEALVSKIPNHDPVGWPTFRDWPAPDSLTHEGTYHAWMERAWRGGLRLFVNLLVENNQLCMIYPLKGPNWPQTRCDDMLSVKLQAQRMREFQDYVDAQYGGPGKGWYRIVTDPFQARRVINEGKLAVVMGIETSVPFGCSIAAGNVPECSKANIDRQLQEVYDLGVRQMELVNKFDNALSGVAGDEGDTGLLVNGANFLENQTFWDMQKCPVDYGEGVEDKEQYAVPEDGGAFEQRDGLFGAIAEVAGIKLPAVPVYGPAPHCNARGLSGLGEHTIRGMVDRGMIFDPDHMSVVARKASLDLLEALDYSGVISSHSWSTPDAYPRIYELGGVVMPYAGDSEGFVEKWRQHLTWADPRYYFGFGYGADINGLGAQGDPRGSSAEDPVTYPFYSKLGRVTVDKQVSGKRVYDLNTDGVAHYGLYPDWFQDLENLAGDDITTDMSRGAEAYLQMWERAVGVTNDGCREPSEASPLRAFRALPGGASVEQVLRAVGQPHQRLDRTHSYCARTATGGSTTVRLAYSTAGRLLRVVGG
jgi:microsomal dipeptidase-like Zn-dependent dipeptidase